MNNTAYKERFKTILIVVLFLSTVLLSYFYWENASLSGLKQSVDERFSSSRFTDGDIPEVSSIVYPKSVQVNFGDGTHCICQKEAPELWSAFLPIYIDFSESDDLVIEEISAEQWEETVYMKSIEYIFDYDLPVELLEAMGASNYGQLNDFRSITSLAYSEASTSSIFIKDSSNDKYFRVISDLNLEQLSQSIDELYKNRPNQYYPISMLLGTENQVMMPFYTSYSLPVVSCPNGTSDSVKNYEKELAETFFGKSLDFVRKITGDNGTITYMYGYGQKILNIYKNGMFEFQKTASSEVNSVDFKEAFSIATSFIAEHGSWSSPDGKQLKTRLEDVSKKTSPKASSYTFVFSVHYDNIPLYRTNTSEIIIEVTGDQVTNYKRNIEAHNPTELSDYTANSTQNASIVTILSYNYQKIAKILLENDLIVPGDGSMDIFDITISSITSVELGYWGQDYDDTSQKLLPSWVIDFSGFHIFFDLYSGEYLGYIDERT